MLSGSLTMRQESLKAETKLQMRGNEAREKNKQSISITYGNNEARDSPKLGIYSTAASMEELNYIIGELSKKYG